MFSVLSWFLWFLIYIVIPKYYVVGTVASSSSSSAVLLLSSRFPTTTIISLYENQRNSRSRYPSILSDQRYCQYGVYLIWNKMISRQKVMSSRTSYHPCFGFLPMTTTSINTITSTNQSHKPSQRMTRRHGKKICNVKFDSIVQCDQDEINIETKHSIIRNDPSRIIPNEKRNMKKHRHQRNLTKQRSLKSRRIPNREKSSFSVPTEQLTRTIGLLFQCSQKCIVLIFCYWGILISTASMSRAVTTDMIDSTIMSSSRSYPIISHNTLLENQYNTKGSTTTTATTKTNRYSNVVLVMMAEFQQPTDEKPQIPLFPSLSSSEQQRQPTGLLQSKIFVSSPEQQKSLVTQSPTVIEGKFIGRRKGRKKKDNPSGRREKTENETKHSC
jgi:hypothetical protein